MLTPQVLLLALLAILLNRWISETVPQTIAVSGDFQSRWCFVFPTILINNSGRIARSPFAMKSLHCPQLRRSQQLASAETMCGGRGAIRKTERGKEWAGEWSEGVVRGIIECLRGPHIHWAAGQGEENGVEERKKRLSQQEKQREKQQGSRVREVANTFRVNC